MTVSTPHFEWTSPPHLALLGFMLVLLVVQCGWLFTRHRHSGRFGIRLVLNLLLWVALLGWIIDPAISFGTRRASGLLIADNVPSEVRAYFRDSLKNSQLIGVDRLADANIDTLIIVGQRFGDAAFAAITQHSRELHLRWAPYFANGQIQHLQWKGILRKGEMQRVEGIIEIKEKQDLTVRFGGQTLDSIALAPGRNNFRLAFPAFSEGRTAVTLHSPGGQVDTLHYFSLPGEQLTVRFLLDNPDFETRNLASWLGKQGHAVRYDAVLSKGITSQLNINQAGEPDLIITSPGNASEAAVRKAIAHGSSVLFLGLTDVPADLRRINQALEARFQAMKVSNDESINVSQSLTALPFRWITTAFQSQTPHYPFVTERTAGKAGVSLLNETFAMQLAGDSVGYARVWQEVLAWARPASFPVVTWDAPVVQGVPAHLYWNNFKSVPPGVTIGQDTVMTRPSPVNDRSAAATFLPREEGWQSMNDSLRAALFTERNAPWAEAARMQHFIQNSPAARRSAGTAVPAPRKLPSWGWFALIMTLMTALWIERKL